MKLLPIKAPILHSELRNKFMKTIENLGYRKVKFLYYLKNTILFLMPRKFYQIQLQSELNKLDKYNRQYILLRLNYYNKKIENFTLSKNALTNKQLKMETLSKKFKHSAYFFDLYNIFSFFDSNKKLDCLFGDITYVPTTPSIVKSRPITDSNNSILMKLNRVRHFHFINDDRKFSDKKYGAVWRGNGNNSEIRQYFLQNYNHIPAFNIGQRSPIVDTPWYKGFMSIYDQLDYKFIFCIEGHDVATNLKWAMSSNSICIMPKPRYETWFMEGTLKPDVHYIEVKDDFSDAEEKMSYYSKNETEALKIIENAHNHVEQFKDIKKEKLISLLVLDRYFSLSGQNNA